MLGDTVSRFPGEKVVMLFGFPRYPARPRWTEGTWLIPNQSETRFCRFSVNRKIWEDGRTDLIPHVTCLGRY